MYSHHKTENIQIYLNYESNTIKLEDQIIYIETKDLGQIVIAYNHTYMIGEGKSLKIKNNIYDGNYIYYIKDNILNVYFQ